LDLTQEEKRIRNKGLRFMANSPQAKKRARQNERRALVNQSRRSRIRTFIRKVEEAIASGDQAAAAEALKAAQPEVMRGVNKGIFHKNTASRKISRLAARVKALG
jgi:small subunit ribosomal protein S20